MEMSYNINLYYYAVLGFGTTNGDITLAFRTLNIIYVLEKPSHSLLPELIPSFIKHSGQLFVPDKLCSKLKV